MSAAAAVIDASVAIRWLLPDPQSELAMALLRDLLARQLTLTAPPLLISEVANLLARHVAQRTLLPEEARAAWNGFRALRIDIQEPPRLYPLAFDLAERLNRPGIHDCCYAALSEILRCEYWTANRRFYAAAQVRLPQMHWLGDVNAGS